MTSKIIAATLLLALSLTFSTTSMITKKTIRTEPKEAMFYQKLAGTTVQCNLCYRRCIIANGTRGFCRVRENIDGTLYSLVYERPVGLQVDPIELEPMYHLLPGHNNLCVYTASCNFRCKHCHNWHISQRGFEEIRHRNYTAAEVVAEAVRLGCESISHSINEPTIFYEYMYDIAKIARENGLKVIFHTNGYMMAEPLKKLLNYVDGVTVDLKGFNDKFYNEIPEAELENVLKTLQIIRGEEKHLEIVNLVIPGLNDDLQEIEDMCLWIKVNLGADVPLHFTRFSPSYQLTKLSPTPVSTLEKAREIAVSTGLKYVYIGNVAGHKANSTYCPECRKALIRRSHIFVIDNKIDDSGECPYCGEEIVGIWE